MRARLQSIRDVLAVEDADEGKIGETADAYEVVRDEIIEKPAASEEPDRR